MGALWRGKETWLYILITLNNTHDLQHQLQGNTAILDSILL